MEIVIQAEGVKTTIRIEEKDSVKLIDAVYWFLRDNKIVPIIETENI